MISNLGGGQSITSTADVVGAGGGTSEASGNVNSSAPQPELSGKRYLSWRLTCIGGGEVV
jgi:hypothetical protein